MWIDKRCTRSLSIPCNQCFTSQLPLSRELVSVITGSSSRVYVRGVYKWSYYLLLSARGEGSSFLESGKSVSVSRIMSICSPTVLSRRTPCKFSYRPLPVLSVRSLPSSTFLPHTILVPLEPDLRTPAHNRSSLTFSPFCLETAGFDTRIYVQKLHLFARIGIKSVFWWSYSFWGTYDHFENRMQARTSGFLMNNIKSQSSLTEYQWNSCFFKPV